MSHLTVRFWSIWFSNIWKVYKSHRITSSKLKLARAKQENRFGGCWCRHQMCSACQIGSQCCDYRYVTHYDWLCSGLTLIGYCSQHPVRAAHVQAVHQLGLQDKQNVSSVNSTSMFMQNYICVSMLTHCLLFQPTLSCPLLWSTLLP